MKRSFFYLFTNILILHFFCQLSYSTDSDTTVLVGSSSEMYQNIIQKIQAKAFNDADAILNNILLSKKMSVDGKRILEEIYAEFTSFRDENILNAWVENSKSTHFSYAIRGIYSLQQAKDLRGTDYARSVNEARSQKIKELLQKAQADFENAYSLAPSDPSSSSNMILLCLLKGYPREIMEKWFNRAITADSFWLAPYMRKSAYIRPMWYGKPHEAEKFDENCFKNSPQGSSVYAIVFSNLELSLDIDSALLGANLVGITEIKPEFLQMIAEGIKRLRRDFSTSTLPDYYEGLYHYYSKNIDDALVFYEKVITNKPSDIKTLKAKIVALLRSEQLKRAEVELNNLLKIEPDCSFALANLGVLQFTLHNNIDKGLEFFLKAIASETDLRNQREYYSAIASLLNENKRHDKAIELYTIFLEVDPNSSSALIGRAITKHISGDLSGAIEDLLIEQQRNGPSQYTKELLRAYMDEQSGKRDESHNQTNSPRPISQHVKDIQTADIKEDGGKTFSPAMSNEGIDQQYNQCENLYFRKMKDEATGCFSGLIRRAPEYAPTYYMLGKIAENLEYDFRKAGYYYGVAVSKDPNNQHYILLFGKSLYMQRQYEQAIAVFTKLIQTNSANGEAYYQRGLCFNAVGQIENAVKDMQLATIHNPNTSEAQQEAFQYVQKHIQREVEKPQISKVDELRMIAEQNFMFMRFDEAEKVFQEVLKMDPKQDSVYFQLGILYLDRDKDSNKALLNFDEAIKLNATNAHYYLQRATTLSFVGKCELALNDYDQALILKPNDEHVYDGRASCYEKLGEFEKAQNDWHAALKYAKDKDSYYSKLAGIAARTGKLPENDSNDVTMLVKRGKAFMNKNEFDLAKKDFLRAIEIDPSIAATYYELAVLCFEKMHMPEDALLNISMAITIETRNRDYYFMRGNVYNELKDFENAKNDYSKAIEISPKDGQALYYRGNCNRALGLKDEAIEDYMKVKQLAPSWNEAITRHLEEMR